MFANIKQRTQFSRILSQYNTSAKRVCWKIKTVQDEDFLRGGLTYVTPAKRPSQIEITLNIWL